MLHKVQTEVNPKFSKGVIPHVVSLSVSYFLLLQHLYSAYNY